MTIRSVELGGSEKSQYLTIKTNTKETRKTMEYVYDEYSLFAISNSTVVKTSEISIKNNLFEISQTDIKFTLVIFWSQFIQGIH